MRYGFPAALALLLVLSIPATAQSRSFDLTGNVVWLDPTGGGTFEDITNPADIDFDADIGYGLAANIFFTDRISAEFAISRVEADTRIRRPAVGASTATLEMTPITGVLQFHFAPNGFIDPYIGGGAAYMLYDFSEGQGVTGLNQIDFDDDVGFAVNAGLGIRLGNRFGLNVDAKYVPIESNAQAVVVTGNQDTEARIDVSPIIVSAGLSLRF